VCVQRHEVRRGGRTGPALRHELHQGRDTVGSDGERTVGILMLISIKKIKISRREEAF
jgi:hypothetical protein